MVSASWPTQPPSSLLQPLSSFPLSSRNPASSSLCANLQTNLSLYTITALLILDSDGNRVLAKYYVPPHQPNGTGSGLAAELGVGPGGTGMGLGTLKEQRGFEKSVAEKIRRGGGESRLVASATSAASPCSSYTLRVDGSGSSSKLTLAEPQARSTHFHPT